MILDERTRAVPLAEPEARPPEAVAVERAPLGAVLSVLPAVALVELLLTRTFYRVGIFIPKQGPFRAVYAVLTAIGSFSLNLSSVLAFIALALLAVRAARHGSRALAIALAAFGAGALLAALPGASGAGPVVRLAFVLVVALVAWPFVRRPGPLGHRLGVAAAALAVLLSSYAGMAGDATRLFPAATGPAGAVLAQLAGEALAVIAAYLFFAGWVRERGFGRKAVTLGAFPAAALAVAWWANGAITGILVLWTAGLRLYLPVWLYVLGFWAFCAAAVGRLGGGTRRAGGLILLVAAGFLLDSTYAQLLMILALVLLTDGLAVGGAGGFTMPATHRPRLPATAGLR